MRVAFSGAHATGKSTLIEELRRLMPLYDVVEEPYYGLIEHGHTFADEPSVEDFELQLERSVETLLSVTGPDVLFDRCPADFLGYLAVIESDSVAEWLAPAQLALASLDLVVFVPVEHPDRISSDAATSRLRQRVDSVLRAMLLADEWDLGLRTIDVQGPPDDRVRRVLAYVERR